VRDVRELLACPACQSDLTPDWACRGCGSRFSAPDGIPNLRLEGMARTEAVRAFYKTAPFPGYPARESLSTFRARAGRKAFAQLLDRSIPGDARVAEVGCGTGQMSLFLAHADRTLVASDLSRPSLLLGAAAARRFGIDQVQFVETDLHRSALRSGTFDVVYSSGVLHHTPDPQAAFAATVRLARHGGVVIVGVYNAVARVPLRVRRVIARATRFRVVPFDPVLRERHSDPARREAWLRDQYQHPEEHSHTVAEVRRWFEKSHVEYVRTFPSTVLDDEPDDLFGPAIDDWRVESWLAQLGWMRTLGREGGLFFTIGTRI
jgi:SAM-dependent methyltransferase